MRPDGSVWVNPAMGGTQNDALATAELRGVAIHRGKWYFEVDMLDPVAAGMMSQEEQMRCMGRL